MSQDFQRGVKAYERYDYATALREWRPLAEQGNAKAQYNLGAMYENGDGVPQDYAEAVRWYRKAAEQSDARAQFNLGVMYLEGRGVRQDHTEAMKWYRKAAEQGEADAQNNLGVIYDNGRGVPQDYAEAVRWYRGAANLGYAPAQYNLGFMYYEGRGVPQDYAEAAGWYRKAAKQGDADAQYNLGVMYDNGRGVPQDYAEAIKWYRQAAEQGDAEAQNKRLAREWLAGSPREPATKTVDMASLSEPQAALDKARDGANYAEAMPYVERALALAEEMFAKRDPEYAAVLRDAADVYIRFPEGRDQVKRLLRSALRRQKKALGVRHPNVAVTLYKFADYWNVQNDMPPLFTRTWAEPTKAPSRKQLKRADALHDEADRHLRGAERLSEESPQAEPWEAARLLMQALQIRREALGPEDPTVLRTFDRLGDVYSEFLNQRAQAEACYRIALEIAEKRFGRESWPAARALLRLSEYYRKSRRDANAESLLKEAQAIVETEPGSEVSDRTFVLEALAEVTKYKALRNEFDRLRFAFQRAQKKLNLGLSAGGFPSSDDLVRFDDARRRLDSFIEEHEEFIEVWRRSQG
jgi:TPR repeat protein